MRGYMTPEFVANIGSGRRKGSKNKGVTVAELTQQALNYAASKGVQTAVVDYLVMTLNDEKARRADRNKAAQLLNQMCIIDANVTKIAETKPEVSTAIEAKLILDSL